MILLEWEINIDEVNTYKQPYYHPRSDDRRDPKFYKSSTVRSCQDDMHPMQTWMVGEESDDMMLIPYSKTWEQAKKIRSVTVVHSTFWLKGMCFFSGLKKLDCEMTRHMYYVPCDLVRRLQVKLGEMAKQGWGTKLLVRAVLGEALKKSHRDGDFR